MKNIFDSFLTITPIAHRGLHNNETGVPENSLLAFQRAIDAGYAIEFDVQQLVDGTPIVFHDVKLGRMTGADVYTADLQPEELKKFNLLGTTEAIPNLQEALDFINGRAPVLIEIKNSFKPGVFERKIVQILNDYSGEVAIVSFNPYVLSWFKNHAPQFIRGQLSSFFQGDTLSPMKKLFLKRLKFTGITKPQFIAYDTRNLPNRFVKRFKHLPLLAWTVKTNEEHLRITKYCDNIIFEGFEPNV